MWNFFLRNRKFTSVLMTLIVIVGLVSVFMIPKEAMPDVDFPIAVVSTSFPGASALDVEQFVTDEIESRVLHLEDVDNVTSTSSRGMSTVVVEFDVDANSFEKMNDLKDAVDLAKPSLPDEANDPMVQKISFDEMPIISVSVSGPYNLAQLKSYAEDLKTEIERVAGVSKVNVLGGEDREISVLLDRAQLNSYNLSIGQVIQAISMANTDIPVGSIETAGEIFAIRFSGKMADAEDIRNVPVGSVNDTPVLVRDVGQVVDGYREVASISQLSVDGSKPEPSVTLSIYKVSGGNVLSIVKNIEQTMAEAQADFLPNDLLVKKTEDNAAYIRQDLSDLSVNGLETIVIVFLLLLAFLGLREAFIAGAAIPMTFLISFAVLASIGFTLNSLTLFSLILALGILVDSAIVVTEAMNRAIRAGESARDAAFLTIAKFKLPLISGTLTTVFAFIPMLLTSGIMGEYIRSIPISVSIVLLASLFVALAIVPVLSMKHMAADRRQRRWFGLAKYFRHERLTGLAALRERLIESMGNRYTNFLSRMLGDRRKFRLMAITLSVAFALSVALPFVGLLKVNMFPVDDSDVLYINFSAPLGTTLGSTFEAMSPIETLLLADDQIESFVLNAGSSYSGGFGFGSSSPQVGFAVVNLHEDRSQTSSEITERYRAALAAEYDGSVYQVDVSQPSSGPGGELPVVVRITGDDLIELESLANQIADELRDIEGATGVGTSIAETNGEFVVYVDRQKAQLYGLTAMQIAGLLRNSVYGSEATTLSIDSNDVGVNVRYQLDPNAADGTATRVADIGDIGTLTVTTPRGTVPLSTFLTTRFEGSQASISHEDGNRVVRVESDLLGGATAQVVLNDLSKRLERLDIPSGYTINFGGDMEAINESFTDLFRAMILGIFMIAGLLIWQFKSYRQPLFVLVTIPLALIGVFPGLTLVGQPLTFPGFIGVVALAGIVVNNAIILIDEINSLRKGGADRLDAIREAARTRLQPILLTTITTVAGILPLAITNPTWGPLGYSIAFGLLFSTVLTLFVVPMLYARYGEEELD
ncbi:MAG: efflux RND transporter permease subunit [Patescibacteria group bacterium]